MGSAWGYGFKAATETCLCHLATSDVSSRRIGFQGGGVECCRASHDASGLVEIARQADLLACPILKATGSAAFEEGGGPVSGNTTAPTVHCKGYHD
jgi:hypothetical protein